MDSVRVHYNSSQPAQLNALAYAQGADIHVAPGQEQHLPHEAWHVVQQAQGRVKPTMQMKEGVPVNDDAGLEREADMMGGRAASVGVMQGKSRESDPIDSMIAQRKSASGINHSPYISTQRYARGGLLGVVAQRQKAHQLTQRKRGRGIEMRLPVTQLAVLQLNKEKTANMVRTVKELTEGLDLGTFAIGGSLALQMWYWALNPDKPLTREPRDIDILLSDRELSKSIGRKIIDKREGKLPEELKARMVESFPSGFRGKQMIEAAHNGFGVDLKEATGDTRWGGIDSVLMPIIDVGDEYSLPIQTPEALLRGLLKKYKSLEGQTAEQKKVASDVDVALFVIRKFEWYQNQ